MSFDASRHKTIAAVVGKCIGFEWDAGNSGKNLRKHGVSDAEAEEVFFGSSLVFYDDTLHSAEEPRYVLLGRSDGNSLRTVVFTIRGQRIRIISARPMSAKDRKSYATATA